MENSINIFIVQKSGTNIWQAQQNSDVYVRVSWKNLSFENFCWNWPPWPDNFHFCGKVHLFLVFGKGVQKKYIFVKETTMELKSKLVTALFCESSPCTVNLHLSYQESQGYWRILIDDEWLPKIFVSLGLVLEFDNKSYGPQNLKLIRSWIFNSYSWTDLWILVVWKVLRFQCFNSVDAIIWLILLY